VASTTAVARSLIPATPSVVTGPCPHCRNEVRAYVFSHATDWENTPGGLLLHIRTRALIGPHACCLLADVYTAAGGECA
jgi:hypothetical protein